MKKVGFLAFFMGVGLTNEDIFQLHNERSLGSGGTRLYKDPSTWEAEAGGFLSLRPAWSTE